MATRETVKEAPRHRDPGSVARRRLLAGLPVTEQQLPVAGIATTVLTAGDGPPAVLLHGPGGNGAHWADVIGALARTHRVVAPDLPGQGHSGAAEDAAHVLEWLGELIERTCTAPPALVGHALGGAIAARFAAERSDRLRRLVLVDALGLQAFEPAPEFGQALGEFLAGPSERTHDALWRHCAHDLDSLRARMGERWEPFRTYNVDRATTPAVASALGALMQEFGLPAIDPAQLERIAVPTTLIWGREDLATPLAVAEAAGARYGWALHVIDDCADDPPVEQPHVLARALRSADEPDRR